MQIWQFAFDAYPHPYPSHKGEGTGLAAFRLKTIEC